MTVCYDYPGFSIFKSTVEGHRFIKDRILESINSTERFGVETHNQKIYHTDWYVPSNVFRPYYSIVGPLFDAHNKKVFELLETTDKGIDIQVIWFQQYTKGCFHGPHTHGGCNFSSIYYIDLPPGTPKTTFSYRGNDYDIEIQEGDIITFPGHLLHQSPINETDYTKTVIAFNTNLG
jgi:hypothetical protein